MKKRTLAVCLLILLAGAGYISWKALPGRANEASAAQEKNVAQEKNRALRDYLATRVDADNEPDEILEYSRSLPPPKAMTGAAGACAYVIHNVLPGSPAEQAGLKVGDLLISVDGKQITSDKVMLKLARKEPGTSVTFHVRRNNFETREVEQFLVTLPLAEWKYPRAE